MMRIEDMTVGDLLRGLAAKEPTPGGGAVAGVVGALAAALGGMVVAYSLGRRSLAEHSAMLEAAAEGLSRLRSECVALGDADAAAYARLNALMRLPADDPRRASEHGDAVMAAIEVPMRVAEVCAEMMSVLAGLAGSSNPHLRSDLGIAGVLALAGAEAARWNVAINLGEVRDETMRESLRTRADDLVAQCAAGKAMLDRACR